MISRASKIGEKCMHVSMKECVYMAKMMFMQQHLIQKQKQKQIEIKTNSYQHLIQVELIIINKLLIKHKLSGWMSN